MNINELRNYGELFGPTWTKNEAGQDTKSFGSIKKLWTGIKDPSGATASGQKNTEYGETTQVLRFRKHSIPKPSKDMYFMHQGVKYEFEYWIPDYKRNEYWDINCKVVME